MFNFLKKNMKKLLCFSFLFGVLALFSANAQESIPDSFDCVSFSTSCGVSGLACGFNEAERVQDAANWENFHCGTP
jgi:hypothetical protein